MTDSQNDKYEILRSLARSGAGLEHAESAIDSALRQTAALLGLKAAAVHIWDDDFEVRSSYQVANEEEHRARMTEFEDSLFASLRKGHRLLSAHLSFQGQTPVHVFSMPLRHGDSIFGAVIGLQEGHRTLVSEDDFLETLAAAVTMFALVGELLPAASSDPDRVEKERMAAIVQTAVTVNHEINNPLTAILGNIQLLLMRGDGLDEATLRKLKVVEESALKIRDVTQRLLRIKESRSTEYVKGTTMLDLSGEGDKTRPDSPDQSGESPDSE